MQLPPGTPPWAMLCLRSAAGVWDIQGVPGPERPQLTWRGRPVAPPGIERHRFALTPQEWVVRDGRRVSRPLRTVVDLARHDEDLMVARIAAESAVRQGLVTPYRLGWWLDRAPDRGHRRASVVLAGMNPRAGSVFETLGRVFLEGLGLGRVEPLVVHAGHPYDFHLVDVDTFVEFQGYQFHASRQAWRRDMEVVNAAQAGGSAVVLLAWEHVVVHPEQGAAMVLAVVEAQLRRRRAA